MDFYIFGRKFFFQSFAVVFFIFQLFSAKIAEIGKIVKIVKIVKSSGGWWGEGSCLCGAIVCYIFTISTISAIFALGKLSKIAEIVEILDPRRNLKKNFLIAREQTYALALIFAILKNSPGGFGGL